MPLLTHPVYEGIATDEFRSILDQEDQGRLF